MEGGGSAVSADQRGARVAASGETCAEARSGSEQCLWINTVRGLVKLEVSLVSSRARGALAAVSGAEKLGWHRPKLEEEGTGPLAKRTP